MLLLRASLGVALAWFTKIETFNIKVWIDLAHLLIEQYKFSFKSAPYRSSCSELA